MNEEYELEETFPLECECGCKATFNCNVICDEIGVVEYIVKCVRCGARLGHFAYGQWEY